MNILITGGCGFIGTHVANRLAQDGNLVTVLDTLSPQVHGPNPRVSFVTENVKVVVGDVRCKDVLHASLEGIDSVVHFAAETGTGQSMYEITQYESVNIGGTANLFDFIINSKNSQVKRVVVASSRSIYGEGEYFCDDHGVVYPTQRSSLDMENGNFDPRCPQCGNFVKPIATSESCPLSPSSFYGLTKRVQEEMILMFAKAKGISGIGLRYQNVYGPGQSLINPYTGILAVFSNLAREEKPIKVFEDGFESRDFVYVEDVVEATYAALLADESVSGVFNVGSGVSTSVIEVANEVKSFFNSESRIEVTGAFRLGDIRHNYADIALAREVLGFEPKISFKEGLGNFLTWALRSEVSSDGAYEKSLREMKERGLMRG